MPPKRAVAAETYALATIVVDMVVAVLGDALAQQLLAHILAGIQQRLIMINAGGGGGGPGPGGPGPGGPPGGGGPGPRGPPGGGTVADGRRLKRRKR
jgi:hypothetical protein